MATRKNKRKTTTPVRKKSTGKKSTSKKTKLTSTKKKNTKTKFNLTKDELTYWTKRFKVTPQALHGALRATGTNKPDAIKKYLKNK